MLGDMFNNNKRKDVKTRVGQILFNGKKYAQEESGYYVCTSGKRKRLHVAMWEQAMGRSVPPGCVIHHIDWDKTHNTIDNLICLTQDEHNRIHNSPGGVLETATSERVVKLTAELKASRVNGVPAGMK